MKPSSARVIVILNQLNWNGRPVDLAVPMGRRISPRALDWLKRFSERQLRPLIYTEQILDGGRFSREQQVFGYGPPEFQQDLLRWQREGKRLW
jgi:hypothetical protein